MEDNPINALVMQAICELSQGLDLHVEGTGRAAIAWIREHPIDLLLLDMNLPDFEGIALLHEMRIACPRHFPKAVAVSADALPQYLEAAKLAGFSDYWTKPLDVGRTLESFDVMLRRDHRNDAQLNK